MIPELGRLALILALAVALLLSAVPMWGSYRGHLGAMHSARPLARWFAALALAALAALVASFVRHDFSVQYVVAHSNRALPWPYRMAAAWGGHEGSLLLWVSMLGLWMLAVAQFSRRLPDVLLARTLSIMGMIAAGFVTFLLAASSPFDRLLPMAPDGRDLNPLLQDPGMVAHPPMLYMGYVGFSVVFALSMAALLGDRFDAAWARWTRPWTTAAWACLTLGIMLGSIWAYYELGWGGWWFWDPVENASFMPWLVGTALIHSLAVTEKRGSFKSWSVLLAIMAFSLSLLGTFLVRSGVLSSVHAFAADPRKGVFILAFMAVIVGLSLALYAWRAPTLGLGQRFALVSKESMLLVNNVLLVAATGSVLLGTLYPLVLQACNLGPISVGAPYFETVLLPLLLPLAWLLGLGPLARWKRDALRPLMGRTAWALSLALLAAGALQWRQGGRSWGATAGLWMAAWITLATGLDLFAKLRASGPQHRWAGWRQASFRLPRATLGMMLAHLGVAAFALGVSMVKSYEVEQDVRLAPGGRVTVAGHTFALEGLEPVHGPNYAAMRATVAVTRDGRPVATLAPEKRLYRKQANPMTEAAIDVGWTRDLYVSLGEQLDTGEWIVRVQHKPFISWIWGGCLAMAVGGIWAASDRRYRSASRSTGGLP